MFPIYKKTYISDKKIQKSKRGKTLLFNFKNGEFILKDGRTVLIGGEDGLKIWIEKCLNTIKDKYLIYLQDTQPYGIPEFDLGNRMYPRVLLFAEIESAIYDSLKENEEILAVENFNFNQKGRTLEISFDVSSTYGIYREMINWTF